MASSTECTTAFAAAPAVLVRATTPNVASRSTFARIVVARRATRMAPLQMQQQQGNNPNEPPEKEPYPGYYRDLKTMGVDKPKEKKVGGKKSLYRADGTAYAPWMIGQVIEDEGEFVPKAPKTDAKGRLAKDPQQQELAGTGLRWKLLGDEIELSWATGNEVGNQGFILQRRRGKSDTYEMIGDYKTMPQVFKSKGPNGGKYSYLGPKPEAGTWVYRISDVSEDGTVSDLSQCLVEIESDEDQNKQRIALIAFIVIAAILAAFGFVSDPQSGL